MKHIDFAGFAALAGDPTRAAILMTLFDGRAIPAGELARAAGVSPATASVHLKKLLEARLIRVRSQGRHRYFVLASSDVACTLEALGSLTTPPKARSLAASLRIERLRFARSCYNHLAGTLAIALADALVRRRALEAEGDGFRLTKTAQNTLAPVGVHLDHFALKPGAHIRGCVDWTERRSHIAGPLGTALLQALLAVGAVRRRSEPRALDLSVAGRELLASTFGIALMANETIRP